jgi:hypothetical protein
LLTFAIVWKMGLANKIFDFDLNTIAIVVALATGYPKTTFDDSKS